MCQLLRTSWANDGIVIKLGDVQAGMDHPSEAVSGEGNADGIEQQNETSDSTVTGNGKVRLVWSQYVYYGLFLTRQLWITNFYFLDNFLLFFCSQ